MNARFLLLPLAASGLALLTACGGSAATTAPTDAASSVAVATPSLDATAVLKRACDDFTIADADGVAAGELNDRAGQSKSVEEMRVAADLVGPVDAALSADMKEYADFTEEYISAGYMKTDDQTKWSTLSTHIDVKCDRK